MKMVTRSSIEWTDMTWNPVTGCTKLSSGCKNCYAERLAHRLQAMGQPNYRNGFQVTLHPHMLERPLELKSPQVIFVNSMSDLFHEEIPERFIHDVFDVMKRAHWHHFQILTKRAERLADIARRIAWPDNVWMGVSVENQANAGRVHHLRSVPAAVRFLSLEPLIGRIQALSLSGIDWVIVGGESGPRSRPIREEWIVEIRDLCVKAGVAFFFKQWGGAQKKKNGRDLQGRTWDQMPGVVRNAVA
jgi:protein gp37